MKMLTNDINRYVNRFERAVCAYVMKGAQHPEFRDAIEDELVEARKSLCQFIIKSSTWVTDKDTTLT